MVKHNGDIMWLRQTNSDVELKTLSYRHEMDDTTTETIISLCQCFHPVARRRIEM